MSDYDRFCEHGTYLGRNCEHCERLVERLREVQGNVTKSYRNPEGPEAADEIERLECQLAISKGKHTNAITEIERLRAALERIANLPPGHICDAREIAREALKDD